MISLRFFGYFTAVQQYKPHYLRVELNRHVHIACPNTCMHEYHVHPSQCSSCHGDLGNAPLIIVKNKHALGENEKQANLGYINLNANTILCLDIL